MRRIALVVLVACSAHEQRTVPPAKVVAAPADAGGALAAPGLRLPDGVTPLGYDLRLEVDPDSETFRGEVHVRVRLDVATDHVWIHADQLDITAASIDGRPLVPLATGDQMRAFGFGRVVAAGTLTLAFAFTGRTTNDEEGLFRQRVHDHWYLFSQGESVFARRITPCFDEPRFKVPWQVTLIVPGDQVALANMPQLRETGRDDGRRELVFAQTPAMPSYLLALAVGPFELVDAGSVGRDHVPVRVAVEAGDRRSLVDIARELPPLVTAIESYLDDPLPWPKLDLVEVPHLFGAMENPGLVTFDASELVGDGARHRFTGIVAHELVHQWFGNLVTPAWWDDLWLSEAFASWLGDKVAAAVGGVHDPALHLARAREQALEADAEDARPLRRPVVRNDDPDNSFDAIAYEKGQAVLAMFEAWLGESAFRTAVRAYVHDHRGGTATAADLTAALTAASSPDVGRAFAQYVARAGAPVVELAARCEGSPAIIGHARDGAIVPVCVRVPAGRACALVADHTELALAACPAWVWGNDGLGYYHVAWPPAAARAPLAQLQPAERIALGNDLAAAVRRGELAIPGALAELRALVAVREPYALHAALAIARAIDPLVDDATRPAWSAWLAARLADRLTTSAMLAPAAPVDIELRAELLELVPADHYPAAITRAARRLVDAALGHPAIDPELVAIAAPAGGRALFDRLVGLARGTKDVELRDAALEALGTFGPELAGPIVELVTDGGLPAEAAWRAVAGYLDRPATRTVAWHAVQPHLAAILARMSGVQAGALVEASAGLCDPTSRAEVVAAFEPHVRDILDGRRKLDRALAAIDRCVAQRARVGDVAAALRRG